MFEHYTSIEQSKKILELGIPANSADCYYQVTPKWYSFCRLFIRQSPPEVKDDFFDRYPTYIPCWSIGQLLKIIKQCGDLQVPNYEINTLYFILEGDKNCETSSIDFSKITAFRLQTSL